MIEGLVIKSTGNWSTVSIDNGDEIQCRIRGKFRLEEFKLSNPITVGDRVVIDIDPQNIGTIVEIKPRTNYVIREGKKKGHVHILASNIDQAILITTIAYPKLKLGFIDRFLLMTASYEIPTLIIFNKIDLYNEHEMEMCHKAIKIYQSIGVRSLMTSAVTQDGLAILSQILTNKVSMIAGHSGVGKSTLTNYLIPDLGLKTRLLSKSTGKGQHTTTFAEMYNLPLGGKIIDTPGIKTLSFNYLTPQDVAHNFKEIFEYSRNCKFSDCAHRNEPKCAVIKAVENQNIHHIRYINYLQIVDDIENRNYWELVDDV